MESKTKVTSKEIIRNFGEISDTALQKPVVITKNGRDRLVLLSMDTYENLTRTDGASENDAGGEGAVSEQ